MTLVLGACAAARTLPIEQMTFPALLNVDLAASTRLPSGVYVRDLVVGTDAEVGTGSTVVVHYTGWLANGQQFDTSEGKAPIRFTLNRGRVIAGWDRGIGGMRVGGRRQLIIPPDQGYRARGNGPVPPNATLVFVIELVSTN